MALCVGAWAILGAAIVVSTAGCSSTDSAVTTPRVTSIIVRAAHITEGRGCGSKATQIYKYVAVAQTTPLQDGSATDVPSLVGAGLFDCFADASFVNVAPERANSLVRTSVQVFAFNAAAYAAAGGDSVLRDRIARFAALRDQGSDAGDAPIAAEVAALVSLQPSFSTTCTATRYPGVQAVASCAPLALGASAVGGAAAASRVELPRASFARTSGQPATCGADYTHIRYRYESRDAGVQITQPVQVACATANGASASESGEAFEVVTLTPSTGAYAFTVTLLRQDGSTLAETTCSADASPGVTSRATCAPLPAPASQTP